MVNAMKQFLYINGDSWLIHFAARIANIQHPLFKDIFIINHSIPGDGNINIINRTKQALADLRKVNIEPWVCLGLSEVGREPLPEFSLVSPNATNDIGKYLELVAKAELQLAKEALKDYNYYICNSWVSNCNNTKSIIDFIEQDFTSVNSCYTVANEIYNWLADRQQVFKFTKTSFIEVIENKKKFEQLLLTNQYVSPTLHLDRTTSDQIFQQFFYHVLSALKDADRQKSAQL